MYLCTNRMDAISLHLFDRKKRTHKRNPSVSIFTIIWWLLRINCGRNEFVIPCKNAIPRPISKANFNDIVESIVEPKKMNLIVSLIFGLNYLFYVTNEIKFDFRIYVEWGWLDSVYHDIQQMERGDARNWKLYWEIVEMKIRKWK